MRLNIRGFLETMRPETPCLIVDLEVVRAKYSELHAHFESPSVHYAVKANPAPEVLRALAALGSSFDIASPAELEACLELGVEPERLSYGNTVKKPVDIAFAYRRGVRDFVFDSVGELEKLSIHAPGSRVVCRLTTSGEGADWPLSRKFGCEPDAAFGLMVQARELGLEPYGLSFHVGSQQTNPHAWDAPISDAAWLFAHLRAAGVRLRAINLGGGLPAWYARPVPPLSEYAEAIGAALERAFGHERPIVMLEPGRALVAEAGVIQTEVVLIAQREGRRWVYLDVGVFGGLVETLGEAIAYPICSSRTGQLGPVALTGPTCDSADVLYERTPYALPLSLEVGDRITIGSAGAYTASYASVGFNGFAPMRVYCVGLREAHSSVSLQEVMACTR